MTISNHVASQLHGGGPRGLPIYVLPIGVTGPFAQGSWTPEGSRSVLLVGRAPHKRNELAAAVLAEAGSLLADQSLVGVNLSEAAQRC